MSVFDLQMAVWKLGWSGTPFYPLSLASWLTVSNLLQVATIFQITGHHAVGSGPMGFCQLSPIIFAACSRQQYHGLQKVGLVSKHPLPHTTTHSHAPRTRTFKPYLHKLLASGHTYQYQGPAGLPTVCSIPIGFRLLIKICHCSLPPAAPPWPLHISILAS